MVLFKISDIKSYLLCLLVKARNSDADIECAHRLLAEGRDAKEVEAELVKCPNMSHPEVCILFMNRYIEMAECGYVTGDVCKSRKLSV